MTNGSRNTSKLEAKKTKKAFHCKWENKSWRGIPCTFQMRTPVKREPTQSCSLHHIDTRRKGKTAREILRSHSGCQYFAVEVLGVRLHQASATTLR